MQDTLLPFILLSLDILYHLLSPNTPMTVAIPNSPNINSFSVHGYLAIDHQRCHNNYGGGKKGKHKHKHMVWTTQSKWLD